MSNDSNENIVRTPNLPWVNQWKEKETVTISVEAKSAKVYDLMGNSYKIPVTDGKIEVEATGSPSVCEVGEVGTIGERQRIKD